MTFKFVIIIVVPNIPQVQIVPIYSNDSQVLKKLYIVTAMNQIVSTIIIYSFRPISTPVPISSQWHTLLYYIYGIYRFGIAVH